MKNENQDLTSSFPALSRTIRKNVLKMVATSKSSHVGSALSIVDILVVLYFKILRIKIPPQKDDNRDRFILSKAHASTALYATLAERGFFPKEMLDKFYLDGGTLPGHLKRNIDLGIEVSSGSLGHGLSIGVGMAISNKHDKKDSKVYVLMSDGECDEGSVWEAALLAGHLKLDNLIAIVDYNKLQSFGRVKEVLDLEPFSKKWESFGWDAKEINGHNFQEISDSLESIPINPGKPRVIIAHTVKGKGVSFMEDRLEWHYKSPNPEQYEAAVKEIDVS